MLPPCVTGNSEYVRTFVICVTTTPEMEQAVLGGIKRFCQSEVIDHGHGAYALVQSQITRETFIVITDADSSSRCDNGVRRWREKVSRTICNDAHLSKLSAIAIVEWIRPLTRRVQRLFGWGDVALYTVARPVRLRS